MIAESKQKSIRDNFKPRPGGEVFFDSAIVVLGHLPSSILQRFLYRCLMEFDSFEDRPVKSKLRNYGQQLHDLSDSQLNRTHLSRACFLERVAIVKQYSKIEVVKSE